MRFPKIMPNWQFDPGWGGDKSLKKGVRAVGLSSYSKTKLKPLRLFDPHFRSPFHDGMPGVLVLHLHGVWAQKSSTQPAQDNTCKSLMDPELGGTWPEQAQRALDRHLKCCKGPSAVALELMKEAPTKGDREHGVCDAGGARFRGDKQWETGYTSVQRKNDGVIPRLCFVHIGKCGGGTMNDLLMGLSGENRTRVFMLGGGNHTVGSIFQSPTYIQLHVTQLKQGTPLTVECLQKRLVILWLCDPVKRFISSFRFTVELPEYDRWYVEYLKHQNMNTTRRADLDSLYQL